MKLEAAARRLRSGSSALLVALLAACASAPPDAEPGMTPAEARRTLTTLLPASVADRSGWATDIAAAFAALQLPARRDDLCAVLAVAEQESSYTVDPPVPGLGAIAWKEIDRQAEKAGVPGLAVHAALRLNSPDGRSYSERIDAARTEKDLSDLFEDFIGMVPLGKTFLASRNPVRTGGPMQVSIAYAEAHAAEKTYPYPMAGSIRREVFTRRGGLYFGIAHLLDYDAPYTDPIYRFADFNAGHYASRNAGFQAAVSALSGIPLAFDGDLLREGADAGTPGSTELATYVLAQRLDMSRSAIRGDLERGRGPGFERSRLYERVFALADKAEGKPLPRAVLPRIQLQSPKITRKLTTAWFAERVNERYKRCLARGTKAAG